MAQADGAAELPVTGHAGLPAVAGPRGGDAVTGPGEEPGEEQVRATEALMAVSRTMTAIVARTLSDVADDITVSQFRVLVLLHSRGPMNLTAIAQHFHVNASNASRTCDQLVSAGKVARHVDDQDRRTVKLDLTSAGSRFVESLMDARRRLIAEVVVAMEPSDQSTLARGLDAFSAAAAASALEEPSGPPDERLIPWLL